MHKQTQGVVTKYVYGLGLIGEEKQGTFKTYHFDYRGSTVAITDMVGNITDTFAYDTYGKLISRTGETDTPFLYNGRDGVMTEDNGLYYMRARYYSPELRRFINADIVAGEISNSPTLNRYAYANGNPVSNVDPMGLSADDKNSSSIDPLYGFDWSNLVDPKVLNDQIKDIVFNEYTRSSFYTTLMDYIDNAKRPENVDWDSWNQSIKRSKTWVEDFVGVNSKIGEYIKYNDQISIGVDALLGVIENYKNGEEWYIIGSDLAVDVGFGVFGMLFSNAAAGFATGLVAGSVVPGAGNAVGALAGFVGGMIGGLIFYVATDVITVNGKTAIDVTKDYAGQAATNIFG
ncbi:MAG: RHS repeat-associated core domain-containing protein [Clostridia bacterium]|nr:RHS repeat-associated core domain-containing protein [Clostridia bacterium]